MDFFEILDLSIPNTRQKYLLRTKCLNFFSLQATVVDRCVLAFDFIAKIQIYVSENEQGSIKGKENMRQRL